MLCGRLNVFYSTTFSAKQADDKLISLSTRLASGEIIEGLTFDFDRELKIKN